MCIFCDYILLLIFCYPVYSLSPTQVGQTLATKGRTIQITVQKLLLKNKINCEMETNTVVFI